MPFRVYFEFQRMPNPQVQIDHLRSAVIDLCATAQVDQACGRHEIVAIVTVPDVNDAVAVMLSAGEPWSKWEEVQ
jgi:hypothetical protein